MLVTLPMLGQSVYADEEKPAADDSAAYFDLASDLCMAAYMKDTIRIAELLGKGADINMQKRTGGTALMNACYAGSEETVKYLLAKGADVSIQDNGKKNALMWAAGSDGFKAIVPMLLEKGADATIVADEGMTPMFQLVTNIESRTQHPVEDIVATAELLVKAGAKIDQGIGDNFTPLMYVSREGNIELVKFLLGKDADVTVVTDSTYDAGGRTAISLAEKAGHTEVVKLLKAAIK